ncbi:hypothetical protein [Spirosoma fluviale]|uniref:Uncharacterized protein n=1 Tax=Spirosoma fluviale TaxID=1597977 RepID=A0A286F727_9BACT|nr:hypothetical protein [Spirosoma fluviale]SOD78993.1 hypothetical protein SAMN06269250_0745 [Spirosoma fluviale]
MKHQRPTPIERKTYLTSISQLSQFFDLTRVEELIKRGKFPIRGLSPKGKAIVDELITRHNIPIGLRDDIYFAFKYILTQYDPPVFAEDENKWKAERNKARNPSTAEGIGLYHYLGHGSLNSDTVEKITITLKGSPKRTFTIAYPELIYFILQSVMDKYGEKADEDETGIKDIIQEDEWYVEKYTEYDKWKTDDYTTFRKKETINDLYSYLSYKVPHLGTDNICRFGAELMFIAGAPFKHGRGKKAPLHDTFVEDIKDQFLRLAEITPKNRNESSKANTRAKKPKTNVNP